MDRTISGLYTPGSIVKPYFALGALNEGIIDPNKKILSTGSISIPNPYFPDQKTVFKDWRANGWELPTNIHPARPTNWRTPEHDGLTPTSSR